MSRVSGPFFGVHQFCSVVSATRAPCYPVSVCPVVWARPQNRARAFSGGVHSPVKKAYSSSGESFKVSLGTQGLSQIVQCFELEFPSG